MDRNTFLAFVLLNCCAFAGARRRGLRKAVGDIEIPHVPGGGHVHDSHVEDVPVTLVHTEHIVDVPVHPIHPGPRRRHPGQCQFDGCPVGTECVTFNSLALGDGTLCPHAYSGRCLCVAGCLHKHEFLPIGSKVRKGRCKTCTCFHDSTVQCRKSIGCKLRKQEKRRRRKMRRRNRKIRRRMRKLNRAIHGHI